MTQPFLGQIQSFGFNFAPKGWALCDGQILPISQYTALFSLLGTYYGGNGTTTFALPNLQSRVPMHYGTSPGGIHYDIGQAEGEESISLIQAEMPSHAHSFSGTSLAADSKRPVTGSVYAQTKSAAAASPGDNFYAPANRPVLTALNPNTVATSGSGSAHNNLQPYLTINWCIAMEGIYPARN